MSLLSLDPRTAPLFAESGCKESDSQYVLEAIGQAKSVTALARGRQGTDPVAVVVADGRMQVVSVGLRANLGHAFHGTGPVRLKAPIESLTLAVDQTPAGAYQSLLLHAAQGEFHIQQVPARAAERLQRALTPTQTPYSVPEPDRRVGFEPPAHEPDRDVAGPQDSPPTGPAAMDWRQAEQLAVWHLRYLGYHDARPTQAGADAGVDVHAVGAVAQVKHWAQPVGQPPLRDLFGVAQAAGARPVFYSHSGYTVAALEWASATRMALFSYSIDGQVIGHNTAAHDLERAARPAAGKRLGFFAQARADRYRQDQEKLRREIERLTALMQKRTQSRRPASRQAAGAAAPLLTGASRTLDAGDVLSPADRRREDTYKVVRDALTQVRRML
ncbi:restriction endonuclease [Micromonospora sp. C72]|uniref:restriction endonuclease n=1 Tax=Micromonospora sp. C72 TaxID=2824880 RepID=UPI001B37A36B|nr:restriction endonuclease [Micromonospora sp. C72]MBQ1041454.1 restriction endonuclease [Micromonospora sp. C72]